MAGSKNLSVSIGQIVFTLLTAVVLIFSTHANAGQTECRQYYKNEFDPKNIEVLMDSYLWLKDDISALLNDPNTPKIIVEIFRKALAGNQVDIVNLTDRIRSEYLIPASFEALAHSFSSGYRSFKRPSAAPDLNSQGTDIISGKTNDSRKPYPFRKQNTIMVPDRPFTTKSNDLIYLAHEIAHVRFERFLKANVERIASRIPTDLVRRASDGIIEFEEQFMNYINERFAHEVEFRTLQATYGIYYEAMPDRWKNLPLNSSPKVIRYSISNLIIQSYQMTDPRFPALGRRSIYDILLNGF